VHPDRGSVDQDEVATDAEEGGLPFEFAGRSGRLAGQRVHRHAQHTAVGQVLRQFVHGGPGVLAVAGQRLGRDHHLGRLGLGERVDHAYPLRNPLAERHDVVPELVRCGRHRRNQGERVAGQERVDRRGQHG